MSQNVQEDFLNDLKKNKVSVTVFLINGVKPRVSLPGLTRIRCF